MTVKIYKFSGNARNLTQIKADALSRYLPLAWKQKLAAGIIKGDPSTIQRASFGPIEVRLCPWRAGRPQPPPLANANIKEPHRLCVFDKEEVIDSEGIAVFEVNHRLYYLMISLYPVSDNHFLLVRSPEESPALLSQYIHSAADVEDLIEIHHVLPPELSLLFNSNPGGTTESGASKNHFHLHVLQFGESAKKLAMQTLPEFQTLQTLGINVGELPSWPASMRIFESTNFQSLGQEIYLYAEVLTNANHAHNLVFFRYPGGLERIVVIPRTLGIPITPFQGRAPVDRLGGDAHVGSICSESDRLAFNAMLANPSEAERVLAQRLRETTVSPEKLVDFDRAYLAARTSRCTPIHNIEARMEDFVLRTLPAGFFNRLFSIRLNMKESSNPVLISRSGGAATISVSEVFKKLDITDHVLEAYKSLDFFRRSRELHQRGELENHLRGRGNPALVTEEGLVPSIPIILELSDIINKTLKDAAIEAVFYTAIFLHDIGKFISQTLHGENSFTLLRNNAEVVQALAEVFNPEQIALIQKLARYHSLYTDTMVTKEPHILGPYQAVLENPRERQLLINDLLYIMGIIDTDAYLPGLSRLSNDCLADLQDLHKRIRQAIQEGKSVEDFETQADEIHRSWGKTRFRSWVTGETDLKDGRVEASIAAAERELAGIFPSPQEREHFYLSLGRAKQVGLISDLRKELVDPQSRVRLLAWFSKKVEEYGAVPYEFRIYREKGRWVGPEVELMRKLLARPPHHMERLDKTLLLKVQPNGAVEIVISLPQKPKIT